MEKNPLFNISIVYHSDHGHTAAQAQAVGRGVSSLEGLHPILISVKDVENYWDHLHASQAIIFGCPTYMGSVSSAFKEFMEKSAQFWISQKWKDKIAAGFTNSSSPSGDKLSTLLQLIVFAAQHSMIWVPLGLLPGQAPTERNRLGGYIGALSQANLDEPLETAPSLSDLQTAEYLGKTVSLATKRWYK